MQRLPIVTVTPPVVDGGKKWLWTRPGHRDAEGPHRAWFKEAESAMWATPADVKRSYASAVCCLVAA